MAHQLELHPSSRDIATFATHIGLFRYTRLNFGTCSASEIFHEQICKSIADITGTINIHDDILVYGKSKAEHEKALHSILNRLQEIGITANKKKCIFNTNVIDFLVCDFPSWYGTRFI